MTDQLPLPGPEKGYCGCRLPAVRGHEEPTLADSCGLFGLLGKPDREGRRHVRGCICRRCLGRRSRRNGKERQRAARKALDIPGLSLGADDEELWRGHVRVEVKSGHRDSVPIDTRYRAMRKQSDASKAIGDNRPFAAIVMPPGMSDGYAIVRLSELRDVAWAIVDHESSKR